MFLTYDLLKVYNTLVTLLKVQLHSKCSYPKIYGTKVRSRILIEQGFTIIETKGLGKGLSNLNFVCDKHPAKNAIV